MEKVKNGYYKAVAIISYISAALITAASIFLIISLMSNLDFVVDTVGKILIEGAEVGEVSSDMVGLEQETIKTMLLTESITYLFTGAYTFVQAAFFNKYSNLTNEQASKYYKKCVAWCVVAIVVSDLLIGILALVGLLNVQKKQKEAFEGVDLSNEQQNQAQEQEITTEKLESVQIRLEKIKELKENGALTDQEYETLRDKILAEIKPKEQVQTNEVDQLNQRLNKLNELKEKGVISEEEYNSLRDKILKK